MAIKLPDLPYATDALEPHVSARTLEKHYGKHHRGYVDKTNKAIEGTGYANLDLEEIIARSKQAGDKQVFNNAAQAWNHTFLWQSMSPDGGGQPAGELKDALKHDFGSVEKFSEDFKKAAMAQFGSGWAWLVHDDGKLAIVTTGNADTPLVSDATPILTLDVWEHAYYLDYQNERGKYIDAFLSSLVNWEFAAQNMKSVRKAA